MAVGMRVRGRFPGVGTWIRGGGEAVKRGAGAVFDASAMENGYNESFNGKFRDELLNIEIFYTLKEAQVLIETWGRHYNTIRPHSALSD